MAVGGILMLNEKTFRKNIELLGQKQPSLALELRQVDPSRLTLCQTKNDEWNLRDDSSEKPVYFHSNYNAAKESQNWFNSLKLDGTDVLYVYGLGLGYYYDAAKKWLDESPGHYLVFIEDDLAVLRRFIETEKSTSILEDKQVQVHFLRDFVSSEEMFNWLSWFFVLLPIDVSGLLSYQKKREAVFGQLKMKLMHDSVRKDSIAAEFMRFSKNFFQNFFANTLCLPDSYHGNQLFEKFSNVPAIICGAGPSLNKNISVLKDLSDKALIFSGGSSLNALNSQAIMPHFGAGIDPNALQFQRLVNNSSFELPFFYRGRMFHNAFRLIHGPKLYNNGTGGYFISEWFEENLGIESKIIDEGNNVANFCVELASALGCNPIIFVGMDLAYSEMSSYASGVVADTEVSEEKIVQGSGLNASAFIREDIFGNPVHTIWKWVTESDWIGDFAKDHPEKTLINATEGGIGFPGVSNMTLKDVQSQFLLKTYNLHHRIHAEIQNSALPDVTPEKVMELMEEMRESLGNCVGLCDDLLNEIELVKKRLEQRKKVEENLQTGKAALYEIELTEEPAYTHILCTMTSACTKIMERQYYQVMFDKSLTSDLQRNLERLKINKKKIDYMREASLMTLEALQNSLKHQNVRKRKAKV
ncbi:MAG: hypothetical protein ACI9S8_002306 [Chlamydiales bacterium]